MLGVPYRFEMHSIHIHYMQAQKVIKNLILLYDSSLRNSQYFNFNLR